MNNSSKKALLTASFAVRLAIFAGLASAQQQPLKQPHLSIDGFVVEAKLEKGASPKEGVDAISDVENSLFRFYALSASGGSTSSFGIGSKMSFPRWVRVTWRHGPGVDYDFKQGKMIGGTLAGDFTVDVLDRIPTEVFEYTLAAPGRAIVLRFRIKDDGVLLAWDVQESVLYPGNPIGSYVYSMRGGDFLCGPAPSPKCTNGPLEKASWFNPLWIRRL